MPACLAALAEVAAQYDVQYYPIISSARAFRALWKRAYHRFSDWMGGVVYEDPWRAGGHNGLSNSEDPEQPEPAYPRVVALRQQMREYGLDDVPIVMAGGVWFLRDWEDWIDNPELGLSSSSSHPPAGDRGEPDLRAVEAQAVCMREGT